MRVLYLHQYFNTPASAGGTRSYEIARRLVSHGHHVEMITSNRANSASLHGTWHETFESGIHVHWLANPYDNKMTYAKRAVSFMVFAYKSALLAARIQADVIFATSTPLTIAIPAIWAAKRLRVPMVFEVRDLWPQLPIAVGALRNPAFICAARALEKIAYRHSSEIIALSPPMKEGISKTGYPADKITVIPNACDINLFDVPEQHGMVLRKRYAWLSDRPLLLYAGTFGFANGVGYLADLAAATLARDPRVCFVAIGDGKEKPDLLRKAQATGTLNKNLFILDPIPKGAIASWFSAADLVASFFINIPALRANSPNKVFDAWAAGRPVATNHEGWITDVIRDTGAGLSLDPSDANTASGQLLKALSDASWKSRSREAARRLARERFSRDALTDQVIDVLVRATAGQ